MRLVQASALATALALLVPTVHGQAQKEAQEKDRKVEGGGITVPGWKGRIDPAATKKGMAIIDSKFEKQGNDLHLKVGPAAIYWNPAHTASGDYTVRAMFKEPKMTADHPHPAGVFIGGNKLDTDEQSLVYCVAYGDGTFLIRGFSGATVNTISKRGPHDAVNKAAADGSVANEVAWTVKGDRAECSINGKMVAGFSKADLKLESTDGVYGIRVSHNMDVVVSGFGMVK